MSEKKGYYSEDEGRFISQNEIDTNQLESLLKNVFIPTWDNKPPYRKPILSIKGVGVLSFQNITCLIAQPGAGKSSTIEGVISSVINKDCDCLGFETDIKSVMYIDFERTEEDVWKSFDRVMKRAKVSNGTIIDNVQIISFRNIPQAVSRKNNIELLLENYKPELLLLDGIGDLVDDTNSLEQAIECKNWIRSITSKFNVSILTTLHPNKGSLTPRGHIGSEILREAEGVLAITISDEIRTLTSDFEHGKARNGGHATTCFEWSEEDKMFMSSEVIPKIKKVKLKPEERLTHEELIDLVRITHAMPLNAEQTKISITNHLKSYVSYVKTNNNDIVNFIKHLEENNYLTKAKDGVDSRSTFYKINVIHKEK